MTFGVWYFNIRASGLQHIILNPSDHWVVGMEFTLRKTCVSPFLESFVKTTQEPVILFALTTPTWMASKERRATNYLLEKIDAMYVSGRDGAHRHMPTSVEEICSTQSNVVHHLLIIQTLIVLRGLMRTNALWATEEGGFIGQVVWQHHNYTTQLRNKRRSKISYQLLEEW